MLFVLITVTGSRYYILTAKIQINIERLSMMGRK